MTALASVNSPRTTDIPSTFSPPKTAQATAATPTTAGFTTNSTFDPMPGRPSTRQVEAPVGSRPAGPTQLNEIRALDAKFAAAYSNSDAKTCAAMYDENAEFTDLKGVRHTGRSAIEAAFETEFEEYRTQGLKVKLEALEPKAFNLDPNADFPRYLVTGSWKVTITPPQGDDQVAYAASTAVMGGSWAYAPLKYLFDQVAPAPGPNPA